MLSLHSQPKRYILQGVYELYEKQETTLWEEGERINRLVFIGIDSGWGCVVDWWVWLLYLLCCLLCVIVGYNLDKEVLLSSFKHFCLKHSPI